VSRITTLVSNKWRSLLILASLMLCGFIATSLISYFAAYNALSRQVTDNSLPLTSDNIYSEIQKDLLRPVMMSALMAENTFIRDWVLAGEQDSQRMIDYLSAVQAHTGAVTSFFVSAKSHHYYHPQGILKTVSAEDAQDAWYFRFMASAEPYEINIDTDTADLSKLTIFVNYKMFDYQRNLIGAIGLGLDFKQVEALFENYQNQYKRRVYLVDKQGQLRIHGTGYEDQRPITEQPGLRDIAAYVLNQASGSFYFSRDGRETFLNSRYVPEFKWYLLVEEDIDRQHAILKQSMTINALFFLMISAAVLWLTYITLSRYQKRIEHIATTDTLTGLPNRKLFELHVNKLLRLAERTHSAVSLILIDVDHFKQINDVHGHLTGDQALSQIAEALQKTIRNSDSICRWGGDEFIVVLTSCTLNQAADIAEKIRCEVQLISLLQDNPDLRLSVSLGLAQYKTGDTLPSLLKRADLALYRAKHQGRNQVGLGLQELQTRSTSTAKKD
jgi:diguanylate cyclase (GGDEF)-like protein